jgi:formamidopyrimidine-DNA glycosylase
LGFARSTSTRLSDDFVFKIVRAISSGRFSNISTHRWFQLPVWASGILVYHLRNGVVVADQLGTARVFSTSHGPWLIGRKFNLVCQPRMRVITTGDTGFPGVFARTVELLCMPELPEVETIARGLAQRVTGDSIESVWLGNKPEPLKSSAREIARALEGSRISAVRRVGKHIVFDLEKDGSGTRRRRFQSKRSDHRNRADEGVRATQDRATQFIVHLGMTGRLQVCEPGAEIAKHTHAIAKLGSGRELRFVDPRRFGRLSVASGFDAGGVEPLEAELEQFLALFRGRKTPIKSALLNQKLLRGVGNIYADEALFRAGIRPRRRASAIRREQYAKLLEAVKEVLREAITAGGSSVSDYVNADGEEGFFQLQHRVYGREGEACLVCGTAVKRVVIAGRSSHYCPRCQK